MKIKFKYYESLGILNIKKTKNKKKTKKKRFNQNFCQQFFYQMIITFVNFLFYLFQGT